MTLPTFSPGQRLTAEQLNALSLAITQDETAAAAHLAELQQAIAYLQSSLAPVTLLPLTLTAPASASLVPNGSVVLAGVAFSDPNTTLPPTYAFSVSCVSGAVSVTISNGPVTGSGTKTISVNLPATDMGAAIAAIRYTAPASGTDTITISVSRGATTAVSATVAVTVAATTGSTGTAQGGAAGYPVVTVPNTLAATAGVAVAVPNLNLIDAPGVTGIGTLSVSATGGTVAMTINAAAVAGSGTSSITVSNDPITLKNVLSTLKFTGAAAGAGTISVSFKSVTGDATPIASVAVTITGTAPVVNDNPISNPADPSVTVPALTIAPSTQYTFTRIYWMDGGAAANTGFGACTVTASAGTLAYTLQGGDSTVRAGATATSFTIDAHYDAVNATLATLKWTSPSTPGTYTIAVHCFSPVDGIDRSGTITCTVTNGATTAETNGYKASATTGGGGTTTTPTGGGTQTSTGGGTGSTSAGGNALRIGDMLDRFGTNTFSSYGEGFNRWGSAGNYDAQAVIDCLNFIRGASGHSMLCREYHFSDVSTQQTAWLKQVAAATNTRWMLCLGAGLADATTMGQVATAVNTGASSQIVVAIEGCNEPNNFGVPGGASGTLTAQKQVWSYCQAHPNVVALGPSLVAGLPRVDGYWDQDGYMGSLLPALNANMAASNVHIYPPTAPDIDPGFNRKGAIGDFVIGAQNVYGNKPVWITEFDPTMYSGAGHKGDEAYNALYIATAVIGAFTNWNAAAFTWYALHAYNSSEGGGLFNGSVSSPRASAYVMRAMYQLCPDTGANRRTFTTGTLAYTVSGLPGPVNAASPYTGGQSRLFQASNGTYYLFIYNEAINPGGSTTPVTVTFTGGAVSQVKHYNLTGTPASNMTVLNTYTNTSSVTINLDASVRLLVITP